MKLLQGTLLLFSLCSLCYSEETKVPPSIMSETTQSLKISSPSPTSLSSDKKLAAQDPMTTQGNLATTLLTSTSRSTSLPNVASSTSTGTLKEPSSVPMNATHPSSTSAVAKTEKGTHQSVSPTGTSSTSIPQVSTHQLQSSSSTEQKSQEISSSLGMITTPSTVNPGGTKASGNTSSLLNNPSYSSVILPVVIALIAITLSVFTVVGLYRMCWKTDPGTPDNGTEQPQSDKESVKLLTVKTISPETSEQSAQGKNKN